MFFTSNPELITQSKKVLIALNFTLVLTKIIVKSSKIRIKENVKSVYSHF
jgi:hypothetical protein